MPITTMAMKKYGFSTRDEAETVAGFVVQYGAMDDHRPHSEAARVIPNMGMAVVLAEDDRGDQCYLVIPVNEEPHLVKPVYVVNDVPHYASVAIGGVTNKEPGEWGMEVVARCVGGRLLTVFMTEATAA